MRGMGKGIREFKDAKDNVTSEIKNGMQENPQLGKVPEIKSTI